MARGLYCHSANNSLREQYLYDTERGEGYTATLQITARKEYCQVNDVPM
ncbi:MAG: hypothetical protein PHN86_10760 [Proteiniphilum sp.]|nr:hypothetical protein [Proteiniphilum sp.]